MVQYSYFPGCNLKTNAKGFEKSALAVSKQLDAELVEMPNWNCCGTVHTLASDNLMKRIAPTRILSRSSKHVEILENSPKEVVTLCSMCNSTLKVVNNDIKNDESKLEPINFQLEFDEEEYQNDMEVKHFLEILRDNVGYEKIEENVRKPLKGLKVFCYYGCMLLHPDEAKIDDEEMPAVLEDLSESLGAEIIFSPLFKYCCGSYHIVDQEDIVNTQVKKIIQSAKQSGANAVVVACPLCAYNLDAQQKSMEKQGQEEELLPIFYFTQLMAIAMGESININHFEEHHINPEKLLKKLKLI
ncbi:MAG: CoB--CoM heterodisulfide reductase iron-sulfur subunit B family protein [Candidatus Heimdallarchaeota archaeon]|nr:CoB--CoM heterodisulfide reductase iron-sulfur subunit B family protein [Candidatus Heimdallarchaeota archaeon]